MGGDNHGRLCASKAVFRHFLHSKQGNLLFAKRGDGSAVPPKGSEALSDHRPKPQGLRRESKHLI
jgi:hypothetical protein